MKRKIALFRFLTVACFFMGFGTFGSYEWGFITFGRCLLQSGLYFAGMVLFYRIAEAYYIAERRRRKVRR